MKKSLKQEISMKLVFLFVEILALMAFPLQQLLNHIQHDSHSSPLSCPGEQLSAQRMHPHSTITSTDDCSSAGLDAAVFFVLAQVEELAILRQCS